MEVIKSVSDNQEEIIKGILELYAPEGIELDPTFSKGNFYRNLKEPDFKFDAYPQREDVTYADCRELPFKDGILKTIMFDPPFIVGDNKKDVENKSIIRNRFGHYRNMDALFDMYRDALKEFHRILQDKGVLIFKCQDTVSCSRQYLSHVEIINMAVKQGFYPKDLFILTAKNRIIDPKIKKQQHCRKYRCFFLVFTKEKSKVKYTNPN